jgi:glutamyl-tRNA synthetase
VSSRLRSCFDVVVSEVLGRGRFAPSPTGDLHLGNLRTAVAAHRMAQNSRLGGFVIRMENLDSMTASNEWALRQLIDLAAIGVRPTEKVIYQSQRFDLYETHLSFLTSRGLTYECYCTRKEIREAASAPHGEFLRYPGTCRDLDTKTRAVKRRDRPPALRLRVDDVTRSEDVVDDIVLRRNDGVPAYNLAVVVDDALQGVTQVVRGIDLEPVTPSQVYLQQLLGFPTPEYVHIGLVVGPDRERLAKRHGSVTLADWLAAGRSAASLREALLRTLDDRPIRAECPLSDIWGE